jgi:hypothetical protein
MERAHIFHSRNPSIVFLLWIWIYEEFLETMAIASSLVKIKVLLERNFISFPKQELMLFSRIV